MAQPVLGKRFLLHALAGFAAFQAGVEALVAAAYGRLLESCIWFASGAVIYIAAVFIETLKGQLGE